MMIAVRLSWLLMTMLTILTVTQGCDCPVEYVHPQQAYCESDYVLKAKVLSDQIVDDSICYRIEILKKYQCQGCVSVLIFENTIIEVCTPINVTECGTTLQLDTVYVLTGSIGIYGTVRTDACDFSRPWRQLTRGQKKGIRWRYGQNCACTVQPCTGATCDVPPANAYICQWDTQAPCFENNWFCKLRNNGLACRWKRRPRCTL